MSEENQNGQVRESDIEALFRKINTPTKEDLQKVFTNEELTELCLKHKCRVDMNRWNVVNDYRVVFIEKGRYQRWSDKQRLRMLAFSVNYRKPAVLYDDAVIAETRRKEHEEQIKENILSLNFWERLRKEKLDEENIANTNLAENQITASEETDIQLLDSASENMSIVTGEEVVESQPQFVDPTAGDNHNSENYFQNINTESMTIDSSLSTQSQLAMSSEDVLPHDYDNFDKDIPMTSTQSQKADSQQL